MKRIEDEEVDAQEKKPHQNKNEHDDMRTSRPVGKAVPLVLSKFFFHLSFACRCLCMAWLGLYDTQLAFLRFHLRCCFGRYARLRSLRSFSFCPSSCVERLFGGFFIICNI
jgi:hypothetical protein